MIPGWGRSPGGGPGNPLQYSCLENPMDRGAWRATVHRVAKNQTQLKQLSMHACTYLCVYKQVHVHAHACVCLLCGALLQESGMAWGWPLSQQRGCELVGVCQAGFKRPPRPGGPALGERLSHGFLPSRLSPAPGPGASPRPSLLSSSVRGPVGSHCSSAPFCLLPKRALMCLRWQHAC